MKQVWIGIGIVTFLFIAAMGVRANDPALQQRMLEESGDETYACAAHVARYLDALEYSDYSQEVFDQAMAHSDAQQQQALVAAVVQRQRGNHDIASLVLEECS